VPAYRRARSLGTRRVWQRLENLQSPGEVGDGLLIRAPCQGIRRRLLQIRHGPLGVSPARKMHGEGCRVLADPGAIARRFAAPNAPMQARPMPRPEPLIHHLLIQCMAKPIAPTHGPIRPLYQAPVFQELPLPRQPLTHHLHGVRGHLHPRRYTGHRKLHARYTPPLQYLLLRVRQASQVCLQQVLEPLRHPLGDGRTPGAVRRRLGRAPEEVLLRQIVHHLHHEQRMPLSPLVHKRRHFLVSRRYSPALRHIRRDRLPTEPAQGHRH